MSNQLSIRLMATTSLNHTTILRTHSPSKLRKLKKSIIRYGVLSPLLVNGQAQIIDGVARYQAAKAAGLEHVPVIDISHLGDSDIRALRIALNRLQDEATWDKEAVGKELHQLIEVGFELDLTGLDTVEIENYLKIGEPEADVEEIEASLIARSPVSRTGDIWGMRSGSKQHRVACGDSRDVALCNQLFGEYLASVCFADAPFNLVIQGHVSGTGKHSEFAMASGEMNDVEFEAFLKNALLLIFCHLQINAVAFLCMDWRHMRHLLNAGETSNLDLLNLIIWTKSNPGMGSLYRSQHELIALFKRRGESHRNNIELGRHGRSRSNVWPYRGVNVFGPERHLLDEHPTPKPSAMVADAIRDVTMPGEIVFDPFLGSGSTLIAAERTHRRCFGIDIEPKYVDLSIRRWQLETGQSAIRLADGVSFADAELLATGADLAKGNEQS